jgi:two-component system sensor histidine kinase/response regulator
MFDHLMRVLGRSALTTATTDRGSAVVRQGIDLTPLRGARMLLVEDNEINREVAAEMLADAGVDVTTAENGQHALDLLGSGPSFDLVLMDVQMPVLDGISATAAIRTRPALSALPVIAMTANAMAEDRQRCLDAGMNDFVAKPIDADQLWRALLRWTPRRAQASGDAVPVAGIATATAGEPAPGVIGLVLPWPVDGLDTVTGLQQFVDRQAHIGYQIEQALGASQWERARRLAHTLKGVAGTLGALRLQTMAEAMEQAIEASQAGAVDPASLLSQVRALDECLLLLIQQLTVALGPVRSLAARSAKESAPEETEEPDVPLADIARDLSHLFAQGEFGAVALLNRHRLRVAMGPDFERLERAVQEFDFGRALQILGENVKITPPPS